MPELDPVGRLVSLWREQVAQGQAVRAEDVCLGRPDLLPEVRRRIEALRHLAHLVGRMGTTAPGADADSKPAGDTSPGPAPVYPSLRGYEIQKELGRGG